MLWVMGGVAFMQLQARIVLPAQLDSWPGRHQLSRLITILHSHSNPTDMTWLSLLAVTLLQSWADEGEPKVMWLAGLHAPETYLAALVQMACRDRGWPLDRSTLYTQVTPYTEAGQVRESPRCVTERCVAPNQLGCCQLPAPCC